MQGFIAAVGAFALLYFSSGAAVTLAQPKLSVVVTTTILADLARAVTGDLATVTSIVPADAGAHDFEPVPDDIRQVAEASLVFVNGVGFEGFIDRLIAESGTKATVVTVTQGIGIRAFDAGSDNAAELIPGIIGFSGSYDCAVKGDDHDHGVCDPHMWQDPTNAILYVLNMRDALIAADPANAVAYRLNAARYVVALQQLDADIWQMVSVIPADRRVLVTNHEALGYFTGRYGFRVVGVVLPGGGTATEPSPQDVAALVTEIRAVGAVAIFTENIGNDKLAQQIAQETGVQVIQSLYTDALGAAGTPGETYLGMLRANAEVIVSALGGK
jgi:ABC-type Zn uptake system ZnuABC Zn-binding protein ZnuA